jgi:hypothetical protein
MGMIDPEYLGQLEERILRQRIAALYSAEALKFYELRLTRLEYLLANKDSNLPMPECDARLLALESDP